MIVEKDASTPPKQKYAAPTDEETKAARISSEQNEKDKEAEEASLFSKPPDKRAKRLQTRKEIIAGSDEKVAPSYDDIDVLFCFLSVLFHFSIPNLFESIA